MTATDDELIDLLHAFGDAFATQDAAALKSLLDAEVCFIASESLVLHDRAHAEQFFATYAAQSVALSFEWDSCQVSGHEGVGWISAFGREIRHEADAKTKEAFRLTLVCNRRDDGWRIAHVHASVPVD